MSAPQSPLNTPEGQAQLLQDLLSAERAGAKVAGESLQQATDPQQRELLEQIRQGEIDSCKLLLNCLKHLGLEPNRDTGAFYGKAMAIESLDERWQRVGIRAMTLPKIGRAGSVLADKTAAESRDRQSVAQAAQDAAITRHAPKPAPVLADPGDDRHVQPADLRRPRGRGRR